MITTWLVTGPAWGKHNGGQAAAATGASADPPRYAQAVVRELFPGLPHVIPA